MIRAAAFLSTAALLAACATGPGLYDVPTETIAAKGETEPMTGEGDRADDPAVWVSPVNANQSRILGTNKEEGLHVYNINGEELQFLDVGRVNNVDVRETVAVASNDETNSISWFLIEPYSGDVSHVIDTPTGKNEPYGICMGMLRGDILAIPTYKDGSIQIWAALGDEGGPEDAKLARTVQVGEGQLEGCVVDDRAGIAFIGEEEHGIWKLDLYDPESEPVIVDTIAAKNGLVADVEGLSIWEGKRGAGYLVASAQAADRFVVYDREAPHAMRGVFTVGASENGEVDAVTHTDGLDVVSGRLPGYPRGMLVVQDDGNPDPEVNQNFKLVDWRDVEKALGLED